MINKKRGIEWAAGLFEGEGSIHCGIRRHPKKTYGTLGVERVGA